MSNPSGNERVNGTAWQYTSVPTGKGGGMRAQIEAILEEFIPTSITCGHCKNEVEVEFNFDELVDRLEKLMAEGKVEIAGTVVNNFLVLQRRSNEHED